MKEITLNIEDFLTQDEMKDIAKEEFKKLFNDNNGRERIVSNLAHYVGAGFLSDILTELEVSSIKKRAKELLIDERSLSSFIFEKPDPWHHKPIGDLIVYNEIQKCIKENIHLVRENVIKGLADIDIEYFRESFDLNQLFSILLKSIGDKE